MGASRRGAVRKAAALSSFGLSALSTAVGHARVDDEPIPADHGAPLRLIVPFRYGRRSIKAITEIVFGTPALPAPPPYV